MPWRVIAHGDQVWHVDAGAERRANTEATSKSSLFIQAERIPDAALSRVLAERLA
jgi:hypothetical protein